MKTLPTSPTNIKMKYNRGDANIVYTYALVKFPNTNSFLTLNPNKFKVSDNSYTENGGSNFPIGIALCKTIELNIDNTDGSLDEYTWQDWYGCKIYLFSRLTFIDDGTYYDLLEGVFYVTDIPNNLQFITIRASDFMLQTELSTQIYTQWSGAPATVTLWDYFVHICGELAVEIYGTGHSASEIYASHLSTDRFTNSTIELSSFAQDTSKNNNVFAFYCGCAVDFGAFYKKATDYIR